MSNGTEMAYLYGKCTEHDGAEDGIRENPIKDVPLSVDLTCIYFVEELHENKGVEDDGVVFRRRCVQGSIPAIVYIKYLLT